MDLICEYVNQNKCVDFKDREIQDISTAVDILMKRFVERMQDEYPDIKVRDLRLCGSMAEKTRLSNKTGSGEKLEFDYIAVLETWTGCGKQRFKKSEKHPGYMIIEHEVEDTCSAKSDNILLSNDIGKIFTSQFIDCVQAVCKRNFCQRLASSLNRLDIFFGCSFCTVIVESGHLRFDYDDSGNFGFAWMPKRIYDQATTFISQNHTKRYDELEFNLIDIDFHPLFVENTNNENVKDVVVHNIALFPKGCSECSKYCRLYLWRKSTQEQETKLIKETSSEHKLAFMTLKYMFSKESHELFDTVFDTGQTMKQSPVISQYMLKNIFLLHIRKCSKKQTAGGCLVNMIELMSRCCIEHKLPHFLLNYDLFEYVDSTYLKFYRIEAFGYCLQEIATLISIPNVHRELQEIADDLFTIAFIFLGSEAEADSSTYMYMRSELGRNYDDYRCLKELPKLTKIAMKHFIHLRHEHSAEETKNYLNEKYRFLMASDRYREYSFKLRQRADKSECDYFGVINVKILRGLF